MYETNQNFEIFSIKKVDSNKIKMYHSNINKIKKGRLVIYRSVVGARLGHGRGTVNGWGKNKSIKISAVESSKNLIIN